jgi:hypothetical protein
MHAALLTRSIDAISAVRKHISFSANLRSQVGADALVCKSGGAKCYDVGELLGESADVTSWRVIDHCAAVTRSYALFESFVLQILREYLAFLTKSYTFAELGPDFRAKYVRGLGKILSEHEKQRYQNLDVASVIAAASDALAGRAGYQLQAEALLRADQNLRMSEIQRLFAQCGLDNIEAWIGSHLAVKDFFSEESRLSETAVSELKQIVDYRNEAAHGDVDDVLGAEVLVEFTHFFEALCKSINDFVQYDTLRRAKALGQATVVGVISERFREDIVVAKVRNATISVGDVLYVLGNNLTMTADIRSIHVNDVKVDSIVVVEETEVGLRIGVRAREGCELISFAPPA